MDLLDIVLKKNEHPKKSLENLFWKELTNSTYGKTAQGLRERRVFDLKALDTRRLEESKITIQHMPHTLQHL